MTRPVSSAAAAIPQDELVLGRYRPVQPLGSGGSGSVWLARDELEGDEVTLKIVAREGKAAARAEREHEAAERLDHERCLKARDFGTDAEHSYIAYEYVPGETFRHALRAGRLNDGATVEAGAQILEGLAHAHELGIVHRDIKPSNVLLADDEDGVSVRLLDFGLALFDEADTLTAAGDVPGTLAYISPERLKGQTAGPEADVWAVGVLLWEALAGFHPYWTSSMLETAKRIQEQPPSLGTARPDLPAAADRARRPRHVPRRAQAPHGDPDGGRAPQRLAEPRAPRRPTEAQPRLTTRTIPAGRIAAVSLAAFAPAGPPRRCRSSRPARPGSLAAVAAGLTLLRERAGLAFVLAVPVLPLGQRVDGARARLRGASRSSWLVADVGRAARRPALRGRAAARRRSQPSACCRDRALNVGTRSAARPPRPSASSPSSPSPASAAATCRSRRAGAVTPRPRRDREPAGRAATVVATR